MTVDRPRAWGVPGCLGICCCVLLSACSGGAKPVKVHPVSGVLSVNGSPVANLIIHFVPARGRPSTAVTDAKGAFELRYEKNVAGAIPGEHKVWVEYRPSSPAEEMALRQGTSPLSNDVQTALQKFGSVASTPMTVTVDGPRKDLRLEL